MNIAKTRKHLPDFARVIFALIMRDMATGYGRSAMGYVWAVIEPLGAIVVLSLAFQVALRNPALGDSFPLFYATGYIPFALYNTMQAKISNAIRENRKLLFYPRVTYVDAIIARFILTFLTQLLVAIILFWGIIWFSDVNQKIQIGPVLISLIVAAFLGLGVGAFNLVLMFFLPSWKTIWSIITRPLFLISCVFFLFDTLPPWAQAILWYNPLIHIVGENRVGFYSIYEGDYIALAYPISISATCLFLSLAILRRRAQDVINN